MKRLPLSARGWTNTAAAVVLVWLALATAVRGGDSPRLDRVRLQLKWQHQFQFAGYYAAIEHGYYRDAGLEVELIEAKPEENPVEVVFEGRAEFGVGNSDLLLSRAEGKPAVVLAAIFQHSPLALVARVKPGITAMQDLHGRPMMMVESEKAELLAYFKHEGVSLEGLRIQPHTQRIEDFIEGKVDAMSAYVSDQPFLLKQAGVDYLIFVARAGGIDFYGDNLFTTEEQVKRYPERVRAFREASLKGWEYALQNPEEIVDLIYTRYTQRHSREHLLFEARKTAELMHPGVIEAGHNNPGRWRHIAQTYAEFGLMPADFDLTGFIYDPDSRTNLTLLYWMLTLLAAVAVCAVGWLFPLLRLNAQLRHAKDGAEGANEAKSRYLAFISHEIRTSLNGMIGVVSLLKAESLTKAQRELIEMIELSSESLLKLINSLLDRAQIEAGRFKIEPAPVPIGAFVKEICELFHASAQVKGVALRLDVDASVPAMVVTDGLRLRQVLSNLLSNAVKFTERGEVAVRVTADGSRVRFRVSDTGIGLTEAQLKTLFIPYAQASQATARRFGGTGLGLSISRDLARLLGGDITVESRVGEGTTFTVEIEAPATTRETVF